MSHADASEHQSQLFTDNSWQLKICLLAMFLLAALIRFNDIRTPGHLLDREYTSAIFARAYYFQQNDTVEEWRRNIAVITKDQQPVLEPPVVEYLVSWIYRIMGREEIFYSRFLTNAFWLAGGFFMYLIAKKLLSTDEAVIATAYYLFVPMGIIISRSFQPDSLMMLLFLISLYLVIGYYETLSMKQLLLAAAVTSVTLLLRPLVLFSIFGVFLALSMIRNKGWQKFLNVHLLVFGAISLLPALMYYGYGVLYAGYMRWKISTSFMPYLLVKEDFWLGWLRLGVEVAGYTTLLAAILGFFFLRNKMARAVVLGLAVAYVIFGIAFTFHIHTHPYYHIQLFPAIALCLAALLASIIQELRKTQGRVWLVPVLAVAVIASYFGYRQVQDSIYQYNVEDPAVAREIGEVVRHSPHTVYVARYYGLPLAYYGEFGGAPWPVSIEDAFYRRPGEQELSVNERIEGLGFVPEYYIITNFDLYNRKHQDLKAYLEQDCLLLAQKDQYLVFSSCKAAASE